MANRRSRVARSGISPSSSTISASSSTSGPLFEVTIVYLLLHHVLAKVGRIASCHGNATVCKRFVCCGTLFEDQKLTSRNLSDSRGSGGFLAITRINPLAFGFFGGKGVFLA